MEILCVCLLCSVDMSNHQFYAREIHIFKEKKLTNPNQWLFVSVDGLKLLSNEKTTEKLRFSL